MDEVYIRTTDPDALSAHRGPDSVGRPSGPGSTRLEDAHARTPLPWRVLRCLAVAPRRRRAARATCKANNPELGPAALALPDTGPPVVFPTNKQNEPSIAFNAADSPPTRRRRRRYRMVAGTNDEQEQPRCGPARAAAPTPASDCSFFPGVGTDGVYTSSDGGETWTNRGLIDDSPAWKAANFVSDGDPVIVSGPKPTAGARLHATPTARASTT